MATRASNRETPQRTGARTKRLRKGDAGALTVRPGTVGGGRAVGQQNKLSRQAKDNIVEVFVKLGGVPAMVRWAKKKENQSIFYSSIYARLIPKDVQHGPSEGLEEMLAKLAEKRSDNTDDVLNGDYVEVQSD